MPCLTESIFAILARKWNVSIIEELHRYPDSGFNELSCRLKLVTPKILSEHLRDLERKSIITKKIKSINPLRVAYALTAKGKECKLIIRQIKIIGDRSQCCQSGEEPKQCTDGVHYASNQRTRASCGLQLSLEQSS